MIDKIIRYLYVAILRRKNLQLISLHRKVSNKNILPTDCKSVPTGE